MYQVEQLATESGALRNAVATAAPFRPRMVKIKLLWACNLACPMCDYWRMGGQGALSTEVATALLNELADLGCRKVHFSGGEPALRDDLPDLVAHARALKLRVTLTTNGTLLAGGMAKSLVKAGLNSACVSLDSPVKKVHDRLRATPGAFKATMKGVGALRRAADARGVALPVRINTVVCRENYATLAGMPDLVAAMGGSSLLLLPVDDPSGALLLSRQRLHDYNTRIAPELARGALALGLMRDPREAFPFGLTADELAASRDGHYSRGMYASQPCYAPWTHALVAADGRVAPCCSAPRVTLGDLHETSFGTVWRGEPYRRLREGMRDGSPLPHCAGCDVFLQENRALHRIVTGGGCVLEWQAPEAQ